MNNAKTRWKQTLEHGGISGADGCRFSERGHLGRCINTSDISIRLPLYTPSSSVLAVMNLSRTELLSSLWHDNQRPAGIFWVTNLRT